MKNRIISLALVSIFAVSILACNRKPKEPDPTPTPTATADPADAQPATADDFFKKMTDAGYTKKKEEIAAEIKKLSALKISAWDGNVKLPAMFEANKAHFKPEIKDAAEFKTKGIDFAKKGGDLYVNHVAGSASNTYPILKLDPKTFENISVSAKGTILSYDQATAAPTAKVMLLVPPDVYK
ncbi:MAG: hypothetical protein AABZ74_13095 [Cyanobacteriota bacterium]